MKRIEKVITIAVLFSLVLSSCERLDPVKRTHISPSSISNDERGMIEVNWDLLTCDSETDSVGSQTMKEGTSVESILPLRECKKDNSCKVGEGTYKFPYGFEKCNRSTGECEDFELTTPLQCSSTGKDTNKCDAFYIQPIMTLKKTKNHLIVWSDTDKSKKKNKMTKVRSSPKKKEGTPSEELMRCISVKFELSELSAVNDHILPKGEIRAYEGETIESILTKAGFHGGDDEGLEDSIIFTNDDGVSEEFDNLKLRYESKNEYKYVRGNVVIKCDSRLNEKNRQKICDNIVIRLRSSEDRLEEKRLIQEECSTQGTKSLVRLYMERKKANKKCVNSEDYVCYEIFDINRWDINKGKLNQSYHKKSTVLHPDKCSKCESISLCNAAYEELTDARAIIMKRWPVYHYNETMEE